MNFYRRNLPHLQPHGGEFFVTFNLKDSIPKSVIHELKLYKKNLLEKKSEKYSPKLTEIDKEIFLKYDSILDNSSSGPQWLKEGAVSEIVKEALHYRDQKEYDLYTFCIMSNHVHLVFKHLVHDIENLSKHPVTDILAGLKKFTARKCNIILQRSGSFWQAESFDRLIRNDKELEKTISYTLNNPVKAGLVNRWEEWPNSYVKSEFIEAFL